MHEVYRTIAACSVCPQSPLMTFPAMRLVSSHALGDESLYATVVAKNSSVT